MENASTEELLTPAEASYYLASQHGVRLSPESLRRRADAGTLGVRKTPSGRRLIPREALDQLAAARAALTESAA